MNLNRFSVTLISILFRLRNKFRRKLGGLSKFSSSPKLSDSQATYYVDRVRVLLNSNSEIEKFRKDFDYREILEHVDFKLGKKYYEGIKKLFPKDFEGIIKQNKENDAFGKPITFHYSRIGKVSPTTLRYIYTAVDIDSTVGIRQNDSIAEIGIGYGGQAAVLSRMFGIKKLIAFDLPEVIELANIFLERINSGIFLDTQESLSCNRIDLVISNYAFSELPLNLQTWYLENVISLSKKGYMIMNSGLNNFTGRSRGKMSLEQIRNYIPMLQIKEEKPLSGPDNYVIYWQ